MTVSPIYYRPGDAIGVNLIIEEAAKKYPNERVVRWNDEAQAHPSCSLRVHCTSSPECPKTSSPVTCPVRQSRQRVNPRSPDPWLSASIPVPASSRQAERRTCQAFRSG